MIWKLSFTKSGKNGNCNQIKMEHFAIKSQIRKHLIQQQSNRHRKLHNLFELAYANILW